MWMFSEHGFYSVVEYVEEWDMTHTKKGRKAAKPKGAASDKVLVRTRFREDMEYLVGKIPTTEIVEMGQADYRFRVTARKKDWAKFAAREALGIDYTNFKSRVARTLGDARHDQLLSVWGTMRRPLSSWKPRRYTRTGGRNQGKTQATLKLEELDDRGGWPERIREDEFERRYGAIDGD